MIFIKILIVLTTAFGMAHPEMLDEPFETAITFTSIGKIIFGGRSYVVPISLDVEDLFILTEPIMKGLENIKQNYELISNRGQQINFQTSMRDHLSLLIDDLTLKTESLRSILSSMSQKEQGLSRPKRALFEAFGTLGNYLFGLATEQEIQDTNDMINKLNDLTEDERKMLNLHSTVLNVTMLHIDEIENNQKRTINAINDLHNGISLLNASIILDKEDIYGLQQNLKFVSAISYAATAISELEFKFLNFIDGLKTLNAGYMSQKIIKPNMLMELVSKISEKSLRPLWPSTDEFTNLYYEFTHVLPIHTKGFFYLILLPLLPSPPNEMNLYKTNALPQPLNPNITVTYETMPRYFGISSDHGIHVSLEESDLKGCRFFNNLYYCNQPMALSKGSSFSCVYALFTKRNIKRVCKKHVSGPLNFPMIIKDKNTWLYATSNPTYITTVCPNKETRTDVLQVGVGRIAVPRNCRINSEQFLLPISGDIRSPETVIIHTTSIHRFNITLSSAEAKVITLFQNDSIYKGILEVVNKPIPLSSMTGELKELRSIRDRGKVSEHTSYIAVTISILLLIMLIIIIICFKWAQGALRDNRERVNNREQGENIEMERRNENHNRMNRLRENVSKILFPNATNNIEQEGDYYLTPQQEPAHIIHGARPKLSLSTPPTIPESIPPNTSPMAASQPINGQSYIGSTFGDKVVSKVTIAPPSIGKYSPVIHRKKN